MHKRVYRYTAVNHHIIILSTSCVEISHLIILSTTPQCQLRVCETANMTTLYKRETQASIFLCILCIRTYNKANMTNKHRSTTKHVRSRQVRLTDSLAGPTRVRPQQQLKIDLVHACYSSVTLLLWRRLLATASTSSACWVI